MFINKSLKFTGSFLLLLFCFIFYFIVLFNLNSAYAFKSYSHYGAEILNKKVIVKINNKYQVEKEISETIKILSQRGINKYSEVVIPFSLKYQNIKLINAYTLLAGMFKIQPGKHAINIVSPNFAANYPIYSDIKYFTISMPAVEKGAILHYSYKLTTFKPIIKNSAFLTGNFSHTIPVKKTFFQVIYPENLHLNIYLHNIKKSMVKSKSKSKLNTIKSKKYKMININLENLSALKKEEYMPPLKNYREYIAISTYTSWNKLSKYLYYYFEMSETPNHQMINYVNNITKNIKGTKERALKIYSKFVKTFRYVGIGYGISGYKPTNAKTTFSDGYGDSKSLAALLITLLKIAGIKASPVIASSLNTSNLIRSSINPGQFDSVIVSVKYGKKTFFLYPDSSSIRAFKLPYALAGRSALELISPEKYKFIVLPSEKPFENKKLYQFSGKLTKNGTLSGKILSIYTGLYENYERSNLKGLNHQQKLIKTGNFLYSYAPGSNIKSFKYSNIKNNSKNISLKIKFTDKNYAQKNANQIVFHQIIPYDNELMHNVSRKKRIYPLLIGYPFEHAYKIKIKLPPYFKLYYLPNALNITNSTGKAFSKCSLHNKTLMCKTEFISKLSKIPQKDYKKFRSLIRTYLQYLKNYYILISSD